jgi:hypothetical protein
MVCIHNSIRSYVEQEITDETIEFNASLVLYYTFSTKQQRNLSKTFAIGSFRSPAFVTGQNDQSPYDRSIQAELQIVNNKDTGIPVVCSVKVSLMHDSNLPNVNMWYTYMVQTQKGITNCKMHTTIFFPTFIPCILISSVFYLPMKEQMIFLKNNIKIYIKVAQTCFSAVTPSSGSALFVLAKVRPTLVKMVYYGTSVCD